MNRMRKGLAALAAAVFFLSVGGVAQAVIGVPDDVPGSTLLFPFFKVNPARTASDTQDTLLVVTNTAGATDPVESAFAPNVGVHVTIWNSTSTHVYDFTIVLTPHDVWACSLYDLIIGGSGVIGCDQVGLAPLQVRDALRETVDGKDTLVGYATADLVYSEPIGLFPGQVNYPFGRGNVLIGHMYLVNLIKGSSTGFNAVSIETDNPCFGHNAVPVLGNRPKIPADFIALVAKRNRALRIANPHRGPQYAIRCSRMVTIASALTVPMGTGRRLQTQVVFRPLPAL
jgi:hypothetical protein